MATLEQLQSQKAELEKESTLLQNQAQSKANEAEYRRNRAKELTDIATSTSPSDPNFEINKKKAELATLQVQETLAQVSELRQQSIDAASQAAKLGQDIYALMNADTTVKTPSATNPSKTEEETREKYSDSTRVPQADSRDSIGESGTIPTVDLTTGGTGSSGSGSSSASSSSSSDTASGESYSERTQTMVSSGEVTIDGEKISSWESISTSRISSSIRSKVSGTAVAGKSAQWAGAKDLRAILRVPSSYLVGPAAGPAGILKELGGILFPYTPEISYDNQAQYGSVNPLHSNYTQYYYKNSSVGPITVSGKFTVQNEKEGMILLGIQHLLRSLTKMRFGSDKNAGSPPPVCRLDAYGDYMINNVPVSVTSFKVELSSNIDYISVKTEPYKTSLVPTMSTISITLIPMYSRSEVSRFSVDGWLAGNLKNRGYL